MRTSPRFRISRSGWCVQLPAILSAFVLLLLNAAWLRAAEPTAAIHYESKVKPILTARCYSCHGALAQESNLRVDTAVSLRAGGDSGPAIESKEPVENLLWQRISGDEAGQRMPPEGKPLTAEELAVIEEWIQLGATGPENEQPDLPPELHWAFQKPRALQLPETNAKQPSRNPVDRLLDLERKAAEVAPMGSINRAMLLRRVYLDLIGLPPTIEQQTAFLEDSSPDAYERVVDELLASPQYGERWARHWMDIWRYSDWYGLGEQLRNSQKHIWHWRDWIVESINDDLGYDHMVMDMLAADELAPTDSDRLRATGFLARNYYLFNRTTWLDATIEHTSQAFLGLTLNCCKCHDHKYDPLSQKDYYQFRAIFEPHQVRLDSVPGETSIDRNGIPRAFDAHPDAMTYVHRKGDEKQPLTDQPLTPAIPRLLRFTEFAPQAQPLPLESAWPVARDFVLKDHLAQANAKLLAVHDRCSAADQRSQPAAQKQLAAAEIYLSVLQTAYAADKAKRLQSADTDALIAEAAFTARQYELALAEAEVAELEGNEPAAGDENQTARGDWQKKIDEAREKVDKARKALESPGTNYPSITASRKALEGPDETAESQNQPYPTTTTGRRTALAHWLVHPDNPLTARVAVNHIWLRHFGQPLVDPVNDFGRRTKAPRHQALLDWLAVHWQEHQWSMKWLHRLLVTSQAYRLTGSVPDLATEEAHAIELWQRNQTLDPENQLYWCRRPVRMESQVVRDSLLHLAGQLDLQLGGPSLPANKDEAPYRRSLYFLHSRDDQHEFLSMFDDADILRCYRRSESVVPQQALALANSKLALEMTQKITSRFERHLASLGATQSRAATSPSDSQFMQLTFSTLLGRSPTESEQNACHAALAKWRELLQTENHSNPSFQARSHLVHAILNHNDFITIR
jgi:hypothetical protein